MNRHVTQNTLLIALLILMAVFISACGNDKATGVVEVKWDRDACDRCQMMLSERNFAAQIRVFPEGKRSKVYKFDDMGCAVLWLQSDDVQAKKYGADPKTEIWVNDYQTKQWLNAKTAWYIKVQASPMNYGLGALAKKSEAAMNYEKAVVHIKNVEEKLNIHGGNLSH
jgi:nitrous oxide reductase accessory protein NosL